MTAVAFNLGEFAWVLDRQKRDVQRVVQDEDWVSVISREVARRGFPGMEFSLGTRYTYCHIADGTWWKDGWACPHWFVPLLILKAQRDSDDEFQMQMQDDKDRVIARLAAHVRELQEELDEREEELDDQSHIHRGQVQRLGEELEEALVAQSHTHSGQVQRLEDELASLTEDMAQLQEGKAQLEQEKVVLLHHYDLLKMAVNEHPYLPQTISFCKSLPDLLREYQGRTQGQPFVKQVPVDALRWCQRGFNRKFQFSNGRDMFDELLKPLMRGDQTPLSITEGQANGTTKPFEVFIETDRNGDLGIWTIPTRRAIVFKMYQATVKDEVVYVECTFVDGPLREHPPIDGRSVRPNPRTNPEPRRNGYPSSRQRARLNRQLNYTRGQQTPRSDD